MRRLFALALLLCAGCAPPGSDPADAWLGDLRSLFATHDDSPPIPTPSSVLGASGGVSLATPQADSASNP